MELFPHHVFLDDMDDNLPTLELLPEMSIMFRQNDILDFEPEEESYVIVAPRDRDKVAKWIEQSAVIISRQFRADAYGVALHLQVELLHGENGMPKVKFEHLLMTDDDFKIPK